MKLPLMRVIFIAGACLVLNNSGWADDKVDKALPDKKPVETAVSGPVVEGFALSVSTEKKQYKPGEAINLLVSLKNVGETPVSFRAPLSRILAYQFEVLIPPEAFMITKIAKKAPKTLYGRIFTDSSGIDSINTVHLNRGDAMTVPIPINRIFDMSLSGAYQISASTRQCGRTERKETVTIISNPLEIIVQEPPV